MDERGDVAGERGLVRHLKEAGGTLRAKALESREIFLQNLQGASGSLIPEVQLELGRHGFRAMTVVPQDI